MEHLLELPKFCQIVSLNTITSWTDAFLHSVQIGEGELVEDDLMLLNRTIVMLVEMESLLSDVHTLTFANSMRMIEYFGCSVSDKRQCGWPKYLCCTLNALKSFRNENVDAVGELQKETR